MKDNPLFSLPTKSGRGYTVYSMGIHIWVYSIQYGYTYMGIQYGYTDMGIQYGYTVRSDGEVNVKVPRGSVALLLTVRKPLSSTLPYKEEALELLKGRKTYMKWFALRLNPIRNSRWPLVAYLISHILLIKWKKTNTPHSLPSPRKWPTHFRICIFRPCDHPVLGHQWASCKRVRGHRAASV